MERTYNHNSLGFRKPGVGASPVKSDLIKGDRFIRDQFVDSFGGRMVAIAIFLYFFIHEGTLGLFPEKWYMVYKTLRISDFILLGLVVYSFMRYREYSVLFNSKSFLITKIFLAYLLLEFFLSIIRYNVNILEYGFRLKGVWASFLVFPYLLMYKRGGWGFLFKLIFPVAVISNILYIMTALTGIAFLPDVDIHLQILPGGISVYRVYGGTFYGEFFMLGMIYMWITRKFRLWQLPFVILFAAPQVLAFGRNAWATLIFIILGFVIINALKKREFRLLIRQAILLLFVLAAFVISFMKFMPESEYYINAVAARVLEGQEDVQYDEGSYGTRVIFQNSALVKLWRNSNLVIGIGMHPMWVVRPESFEEQVYYNSFSDVQWPAVLAAYGIVGFGIALYFQIYYLVIGWKMTKKSKRSNMQSYFVLLGFLLMAFDTFSYTWRFFSVGLWGLIPVMNFFVAVFVFNYEKLKQDEELEREETPSLSDNNQNSH